MSLRPRKNQEEQDDKTIEINAQMQGSLVFKDPVNLKINGNFSDRNVIPFLSLPGPRCL